MESAEKEESGFSNWIFAMTDSFALKPNKRTSESPIKTADF